jgi:hypothetical protein
MFNNLTIDNLIPPSNNSINYSSGKLNIDCISRDKFINDVPSKDFNSDDLLKNIKKKRMNIRNTYVNCYNLCCEKIKEADNLGLTDIIFELPISMFISNPDCKDREIINYIDNNLKKQRLNTYIIDNRKIFITWKFIELNKEIKYI